MTSTNPIDDLRKNFKPFIDLAEKTADWANTFVSDLTETDETSPDEDLSGATYKAVFNLGLSDQLVLDDGSWQVVAIEEDAFDPDRVTVALDNGETYSLIRTSLVWVV